MSINRCMNKDVVHTLKQNITQPLKRMNAICSNMDGPKDYHTKWSQKEGQIPYDITYMWNLKYNTNEHIYKKKKSHKCREQSWGCQREGRWGRKDWEFGIKRCKLVYIGWIYNKVLLYSTGNYTQYPMINHNWKEYIFICITVILLFSRC